LKRIAPAQAALHEGQEVTEGFLERSASSEGGGVFHPRARKPPEGPLRTHSHDPS